MNGSSGFLSTSGRSRALSLLKTVLRVMMYVTGLAETASLGAARTKGISTWFPATGMLFSYPVISLLLIPASQ